MAIASTQESAPEEFQLATKVYLAAVICVLLGLGIGYLAHEMRHAAPAAAASNVPAVRHAVPTLQAMKVAAGQQAAPLLAELKNNPNDGRVLMQVAAIYHGNHQFKEAANYYERAVDTDPKNVDLRNKLASSLYRSGDVDGAIAQLNEALHYDSKDANALFNLGIIRLEGKGDGNGALKAWQQLLKSNPQLSPERKAEVQKLMADVLTTLADQKAAKGATEK